MASFTTMMDRCEKIRKAASMHDLGIIIMDYPEILFSQTNLAEIMTTIPKIIRKGKETLFDYIFIDAVIEAHRTREVGGYKQSLFRDVMETPGGFGNNDFALNVLRLYARTLAEYTHGECLRGNSLTQNYPFKMKRFQDVRGPFSYMGWLILVTDWEHENDAFTKAMHEFFIPSNELQNFITIFADAMCPLTSPDAAAYYLSHVWRRHCMQQSDYMDKVSDQFIRKCIDVDLGWLNEEIREYSIDGEKPNAVITEDCDTIFMMMSEIFKNKFMRENYFYEYIAMISNYYPLMRERFDVADRYERYFGDNAMIFMADLTNEILMDFRFCEDYKEKEQDHAIYSAIHRKAESIILKIHRMYPNVPARVIELFFTDTCKAFGRGFNGAAPGAMCKIRPMIYSIVESDKAAIESDLDCFEMLMALEGSYGDDPVDDNGDPTYDPSLHKSAKTSNTDTMKTAERKIYSAYHKYKNSEQKIDETLNRGIATLKKAVVGDQQAIIIEGKKFSAVGFLKKALATLAIFNYNKIAAILFIVVTHALRKKTKRSEKKKILEELEAELAMVNEKIEDARGDGNREAKYDLMRTRNALQNAIKRIKYGMGAEERQGLKDAERIKSSLAQSRTASNAYRG